ncbi:MAG: hypothetical protein ABWJ42_04740 [Sulfolobales archaeon]
MSSGIVQADPKRRWVERMMRSAKKYHKICPYYDKKTNSCFLKLGGKCDRDGRFEACPVFIDFLEKRYDAIVSSGKPLPVDFMDPLIISP